MKSHPRSDGKIFPFMDFSQVVRSLTGLLIGIFIFGCASPQQKPPPGKAVPYQGEMSLGPDRSQLDKLRSQIPEEKKQENDEWAGLLSLMGQVEMSPQLVRDKYQRLMRNHRNGHRRHLSRLRKSYTTEERKRRKKFLDSQRKKRDKFKKQKHSREENKEFHDDQYQRRREYFARERDQRKDFESELRSMSRDFEANMREKNRTFYQEHRYYSKRYRDEKQRREEQRKLQLRQSSQQGATSKTNPELQEFDKMKNVPGTSLGADEK